ncbi:MAG: cytochrome c4 [Rhizobacter sp.]|nr:cytochrome c4 [Burkholderiaceae bacterium]MCO5125111.1 cytochrome c4 [Rhizobacter sp.]
MKKILSTLTLSALLAGFMPGAQAQEAKAGDAQAGAKINAMCIGCHGIPGYRASFPEVHRVPMIAGQSEKYIAAALEEYKKGTRKHPTMRAITESLTEQNMADLAAFYAQQGKTTDAAVASAPPAPAEPVAALLQKGGCTACHGENFNTPIDANTPKLAGQHADYLFIALKEYQTKNNMRIGRENPVMVGMAAQFSHAELKQLAKYIGSLPGDVKTVPEARFR